jgi:hypothetical protein
MEFSLGDTTYIGIKTILKSFHCSKAEKYFKEMSFWKLHTRVFPKLFFSPTYAAIKGLVWVSFLDIECTRCWALLSKRYLPDIKAKFLKTHVSKIVSTSFGTQKQERRKTELHIYLKWHLKWINSFSAVKKNAVYCSKT